MPVAERKLLYLLHGLGDDASAWQRYSSIETLAAVYGLVVVMPSAGRSFYIDQPNGQKYFTYLTEELPQYLADVFKLAPSRENTFIAGNSMGGYGAFKAALLHPELYTAAASFSGVLSLAIFQLLPDDARQAEFSFLFGDLEKVPGSEHDPAVWLARGGQASSQPAAPVHLHRPAGRYPSAERHVPRRLPVAGGAVGILRGGWSSRLVPVGWADPALPGFCAWTIGKRCKLNFFRALYFGRLRHPDAETFFPQMNADEKDGGMNEKGNRPYSPKRHGYHPSHLIYLCSSAVRQ